MSELMWSNEPPAIERGAYALAGTFRCLAYLCAGVAVLIGAALAIDNSGISLVEKAFVFGAFAGAGLLVAALLLFLGYVLALLAGIHSQVGRTRDLVADNA